MKNVYDNEVFFSEYKKLRENDVNYNNLLEQPAISALLPDLTGKRVLDIGCGFGKNCEDFIHKGAVHVTGIDISEKMLEVAMREHSLPGIVYRRMDMSELSSLTQTYDVVYSSLAFHYHEDFTALIRDIAALLAPGGVLLFSQEHPFVTATVGLEGHYLYDGDDAIGRESAAPGKAKFYAFSDYSTPGKREGFWFIDHVENNHRRFSDIINALCDAGLTVSHVSEPLPDAAALEACPGLEKEWIKPTFLIVRAHKGEAPALSPRTPVAMRRKDRKQDEAFALSVTDKCEYASLALTDTDGAPYCVPISIVRIGKNVYFHGAKAGRKAALLTDGARVCLSLVGDTRRLTDEFSTEYESALIFGRAYAINDRDEKTQALRALCLRHTPAHMAHFESELARSFEATGVWRIEIEEITGKAKKRTK